MKSSCSSLGGFRPSFGFRDSDFGFAISRRSHGASSSAPDTLQTRFRLPAALDRNVRAPEKCEMRTPARNRAKRDSFSAPAAYPRPVMANDLHVDLRELVPRRRILAIAGAGASIHATRNAPAAAWTRRLTLGAAFSRELLPLTPDSPITCRRFPLSPSEGERAGVRGPSLPWCPGAQTASNWRGVLSRPTTIPPNP